MKDSLSNNQSKFILYTGNDGEVKIDVFLKDETVWLSQKIMAELFGVNIPAISKHLLNIFESGELQKKATVSIMETVQKEGHSNWKHAPDGKILKSDITTAKNYLSEAHIRELNQIVSAYLDLAENRAQRQILMKMADWIEFLHNFLELSIYPILQDKGKVSALEAKLKAEQEYEVYRVGQDKDYLSDFDKEIKRISGKKDGK